MERDFLDDIIAKRAERDPDLPKLVDAALERRRGQRTRRAIQAVVATYASRRTSRSSPLPSSPKDEPTTV